MFGDRGAVVARELTKRFEELRRGSLSQLVEHYSAVEPRGEITVLVGPPPQQVEQSDDLDDRLRRALESMSTKDAASLVAGATALPRRVVYARAMELAASSGHGSEGNGMPSSRPLPPEER